MAISTQRRADARLAPSLASSHAGKRPFETIAPRKVNGKIIEGATSVAAVGNEQRSAKRDQPIGAAKPVG